jgi:hypothetical protein
MKKCKCEIAEGVYGDESLI